MQGYDSYAIQADIELGGTDQKFNFLLAREVQRHYGMSEQVVMTRPLIPGTDGEKKMSKSLGNHIAVRDTPDDMYGKIMSLPDGLIALVSRIPDRGADGGDPGDGAGDDTRRDEPARCERSAGA